MRLKSGLARFGLCLQSAYIYGEERVSESDCVDAGDAGHADPEDAAMGGAAWVWDQPGDTGELGRGVAGRDGIAVSALHRLERQGWVSAEWKKSESNQRAKFYRITAVGKKQLAADYERWERMVATIEGIMARQ